MHYCVHRKLSVLSIFNHHTWALNSLKNSSVLTGKESFFCEHNYYRCELTFCQSVWSKGHSRNCICGRQASVNFTVGWVSSNFSIAFLSSPHHCMLASAHTVTMCASWRMGRLEVVRLTPCWVGEEGTMISLESSRQPLQSCSGEKSNS